MELLQRHSGNDELILEAYSFIERKIGAQYLEITPEVVRRIDLLESLLLGFIEHGSDFRLLEMMEQAIFNIRHDGRVLN
jgi:hypothetical protein